MKLRYLLIVALLALLAPTGACTPAAPAAQAPLPPIPTGIDPEAWASVPAGEFLYGPHNTPLSLPAYEIMLTDVTNTQFARYLNAALAAGAVRLSDDPLRGQVIVGPYPGDKFHAVKHEQEIAAGDWLHLQVNAPGMRVYAGDDGQFYAGAGYEDHPVVMLSWFGARGYCEYYGWRLPSEAEWEKAARGVDGRAYPWGDEIDPNYANHYSSRPIWDKLIGSPGGTSPVGLYNGKTYYAGFTPANAASPYGLYDMAGNVWQWVADITEGTHYRHLRGGSFNDYAYNLRAWTRNSAGPDYTSPSVGFRCAR